MPDFSALTFEEALRQLEQIVAQLEAGNLPLEESLHLYEQGQQISTYCQQLLEKASLRVEALTADGEIVTINNDQ